MFEWKPSYSVQIPGIDAQHQRLFALGAELHAAMAQGKGKAALEKGLAGLVDYTKTHFAYEEQFMRKYDYPESNAHKLEHDKLTAKVVGFQQRFLRDEMCLTIDLMLFLKNWLEQHINGSDQKYAAHIRRKAAA
jgi:hemerythrin